LNKVTSEVRRSYLQSLKTDRKIEEAVAQVRSANEELRLAQLRFQNGVGRNIDVLKAQQDYTSSLIEKARAIVNFNNAQIDLLHDTGLISSSTVLSRSPAIR
jgi:outer membrane protein TolC